MSSPSDVTFVFGHTHKPFQEDVNFREYPGWVNVYNSGGWVIDTVETQPLHGWLYTTLKTEGQGPSLML